MSVNYNKYRRIVSLEICLKGLSFQNKQLFSQSEKIKFHSVFLQKMWNSCTIVLPNNCSSELYDRSKTKKQRKRVSRK